MIARVHRAERRRDRAPDLEIAVGEELRQSRTGDSVDPVERRHVPHRFGADGRLGISERAEHALHLPRSGGDVLDLALGQDAGWAAEHQRDAQHLGGRDAPAARGHEQEDTPSTLSSTLSSRLGSKPGSKLGCW